MRIFLTGATGFVGSAILQELLQSGHQVLGLARSEESANELTRSGVQVHHGDITDLESLRAGAANCDAIIHTAFNHDFSKFQDNCKVDYHAIEALGSALIGTNRPLIVTSAIGVLPSGRINDEDTIPTFGNSSHPRSATEDAATLISKRGVCVSIVRLPPSVHGNGDHAFIPTLISIAKAKGQSAYIGEGTNRWPSVHRLDAARVYLMILEKGLRNGVYHAVAEEGVVFRDIADLIGRQLQVPIVSLTPEKASDHFGWFTNFAQMDLVASHKKTSEKLDWHPIQPKLTEDLANDIYFRS